MTTSQDYATIDRIVDRVAPRFPGTARSTIAAIVGREFEALATSKLRTYIPNLVEHATRRRLTHATS